MRQTHGSGRFLVAATTLCLALTACGGGSVSPTSSISSNAPTSLTPTSSIAVSAPSTSVTRPASSGIGWYAWQGEDWLSHPDLPRTLPMGSHIILLSFTAATLNDLMQSAHAQATMRSLISALHARGLRVVWLIGDPDLVFQDGRTQLLRWLPWVAAAGFDGVNLDAERSQLPTDEQGEWEVGLIQTLSALRAQSTLPIALTMNWNDALEPGLATSLQQAGLGEIDAMIYVSNPQRTEQLSEQVLAAAPDLSVRIAQSIEPQLPITESTANLGQQASLDHWRDIATTLAQQNNFKGILVQSWEDFQSAKP